MKKSLLLTLSCATLLLTGCNGKEPKEVIPSTKWGEEIDAFVYREMGKTSLPYMDNDGFEYEITKDDFGDPLLCIYCFYETDQIALDAESFYFDYCGSLGYTMDYGESWGYDQTTYEYYSYNVCYADKLVEDNLGVEIQFLTSTYKNKPTLGIFVYTYIYEVPTVYPQVAVDHYLGEYAKQVPAFTGDGYVYDFYFDIDYTGATYLEIMIDNTDFEDEEKYFNLMLGAGFIMTDSSQDYRLDEYPGYAAYDYYYAIDPNFKFGIAFNFDYDYNIFDIQIFLA